MGYIGKMAHVMNRRYLDDQIGIDKSFLSRHNLAELSKTEQVGNKRITGIWIEDKLDNGIN